MSGFGRLLKPGCTERPTCRCGQEICAASASAAWAEPFVRRAGEWETTIDNGQPHILCFPSDVTLDKNYVMQSMSKLHAADCTINNMQTVGAVTPIRSSAPWAAVQ
jgi:hypothetical protein